VKFDWSALPAWLEGRIEEEKAELTLEQSAEETLRRRTRIKAWKEILSLPAEQEQEAISLHAIAARIEAETGYVD